MKKILISTLISVFTAFGIYAQDVKFGIKGGLNVSNLLEGDNNTPISEDYKSRLASGWGIFTELQLNKTVSLRLGVEYSELGGKKDGMQAMPTQRLITEIGNGIGMGVTDQQLAALGAIVGNMPSYYYVNAKSTTKFNYVMIPLVAQFGTDIKQSPWRVYVNAGPFVSLLLSGKQSATGNSKMFADASGTNTLWDVFPQELKGMVTNEFPSIEQTLGSETALGLTNITGELKSYNLGVTGNVGIRYQYKRSYFFVEAGGHYGFLSIQDDTANGSNRLGAATVMAGYSFSLF